MKYRDVEQRFLASALTLDNPLMSLDDFADWLEERRNATFARVESIRFDQLERWGFHPQTGDLVHDSGQFFSIVGIDVKTNFGQVSHWTQPIILQQEIGLLGIIAKEFQGVLCFLMQAKIEPGNINVVQLSPTLQATKSNYTLIHKGTAPLYLEYFTGDKGKSRILMDQLQSEQGARFLKKRNRNIIIEIYDDIDVRDDYCWLTLGQIKKLIMQCNVVNMDTRTVISGISFGDDPDHSASDKAGDYWTTGLLESTVNPDRAVHEMVDLISRITYLKSKYELEVNRIPLNQVQCWRKDAFHIYHEAQKYFAVIAVSIEIGNREVKHWTQPLIQSTQDGIIAFLVKSIDGVFHFLVQAKIEAGNFDIIELAPTVQCLTGSYREGEREYEVPFLSYIEEAKPEQICYDAMQSEEGGRFYREQNRNLIIEVPDDFPEALPDTHMWMTLNQIKLFIRFNNYLNIEARSLISAVQFI